MKKSIQIVIEFKNPMQFYYSNCEQKIEIETLNGLVLHFIRKRMKKSIQIVKI